MADHPLEEQDVKLLDAIQDKQQNLRRAMFTADTSLRQKIGFKKRTELTLEELSALPAEMKTYKSIGKMSASVLVFSPSLFMLAVLFLG